jgi:hypothetical protein
MTFTVLIAINVYSRVSLHLRKAIGFPLSTQRYIPQDTNPMKYPTERPAIFVFVITNFNKHSKETDHEKAFWIVYTDSSYAPGM